jgi:hypothetical protein
MGRSRERLSKEPAIRRSGCFAETVCESEYLATLTDPSISFAHFEHHPRLHLWKEMYTRGKLPGTPRKTVTRTEAATDSHDGQTKGVAKTVRAYHAEISTRHTWLGGKTGGGQGRRVGPRVPLGTICCHWGPVAANEAPTSEDSSVDSERGRGMARTTLTDGGPAATSILARAGPCKATMAPG